MDKIFIGGINRKNVAIDIAKNYFIAGRASPNMGINGLSIPSIQAFSSACTPFFQALRENGTVSQCIFQFTIKTDSGSSLHLGGIDSSKYSGSITWVDRSFRWLLCGSRFHQWQEHPHYHWFRNINYQCSSKWGQGCAAVYRWCLNFRTNRAKSRPSSRAGTQSWTSSMASWPFICLKTS